MSVETLQVAAIHGVVETRHEARRAWDGEKERARAVKEVSVSTNDLALAVVDYGECMRWAVERARGVQRLYPARLALCVAPWPVDNDNVPCGSHDVQ